MTKKIIYATSEGGVAVIHPTGELPIGVAARKDVPQGVPYKIMDTEDVPSDRTFRAAWESVIDTPDGTGDPDGYWAEKAAEEAERQAAEEAKREADKAKREAAKKAAEEAAAKEEPIIRPPRRGQA